MKLEDQRSETPFAARDNMLDIWTHITELSYRGFGKKPRKMPKEPKNFSIWSQESKDSWIKKQKKNVERQEYFDNLFIARETEVLDNLCREIIFLIDGANEINPQFLFECNKIRDMQDDAITKCSNLKRELNHVMDSIPSNKNFIVKMEADIDQEISILRGWRKSGNKKREEVFENELKKQKEAYAKIFGESVHHFPQALPPEIPD